MLWFQKKKNGIINITFLYCVIETKLSMLDTRIVFNKALASKSMYFANPLYLYLNESECKKEFSKNRKVGWKA